MRASTFFASAAALAVASAQSTSIDAHPQTTFLQQTNSLGVVTGQPAVVTSIPNQPPAQNSMPAAVTNQPAVNSIPAVGTTGIVTLLLPGPSTNVNSTRTVVVSANNSTTVILNQPNTASASASGSSGGRASGSGASGAGGASATTGSGSKQSNGADANAIAGSFVGAAAFVAAFL